MNNRDGYGLGFQSPVRAHCHRRGFHFSEAASSQRLRFSGKCTLPRGFPRSTSRLLWKVGEGGDGSGSVFESASAFEWSNAAVGRKRGCNLIDGLMAPLGCSSCEASFVQSGFNSLLPRVVYTSIRKCALHRVRVFEASFL